MSEINSMQSLLTQSLLANNLNLFSSDKLDKINEELSNLPSVLDKDTLQNFKNGKYNITLREYSNLNTYKTMMTSLYGNSSANLFQNYLDNWFTDKDAFNSEKTLANAKSFIEKLKENGVSNETALKTYNAFKTYSIVNSLNNYSYVSAKI